MNRRVSGRAVASLLAAVLVASAVGGVTHLSAKPRVEIPPVEGTAAKPMDSEPTQDWHPYIGMWVTKDGNVRQELLRNGRYDEARGDKKSAFQGSYTIIGDRIEYDDDTGFTADGVFVEGILYHGGMVFYREQ